MRIADLRVGDLVVGTERIGMYRRYVATPVLAHWSTVRPAWRVTLADGTELIASGDHRFLSDRGWKHVTGAEHGHDRRPHLTLGNSLLGIGRFPEAPKVDDDYRRGYLCGMVRGDATIGHRDYVRTNGRSWTQHQFRLALTDLEPLHRSQAYLANLGVTTKLFDFSPATETRRPLRGIRTQARAAVETIESIISWPREPSESWTKGFLAGMFDAEGHLGQVVRISNRDPEVLDWVMRSLERLGFRPVLEPARSNGVRNVRFLGGLPETMRFILAVDPATPRKRSVLGRAMKGAGRRKVVAVEPLGIDIPMYDITTGTGDFIADGVVSHNCFARPTHEYLGLDTGRDFDQRIVVKVNAAERLRAELSPARWAGHHIAMGTNTDPYQRAEGKYRLTRSIIEVLGEAANPFSILTKSSLVLRDLDVLVAARERTDVRVNLSIGTLDTDVWRATEPGTPHPRRRLEAVAALNDAGIPCGVLVAPILPGLSDGREQLEAVATACVEAGAVSVSAILLHLRPGVKQHYLETLRASHPERGGCDRAPLPEGQRAEGGPAPRVRDRARSGPAGRRVRRRAPRERAPHRPRARRIGSRTGPAATATTAARTRPLNRGGNVGAWTPPTPSPRPPACSSRRATPRRSRCSTAAAALLGRRHPLRPGRGGGRAHVPVRGRQRSGRRDGGVRAATSRTATSGARSCQRSAWPPIPR